MDKIGGGDRAALGQVKDQGATLQLGDTTLRQVAGNKATGDQRFAGAANLATEHLTPIDLHLAPPGGGTSLYHQTITLPLPPVAVEHGVETHNIDLGATTFHSTSALAAPPLKKLLFGHDVERVARYEGDQVTFSRQVAAPPNSRITPEPAKARPSEGGAPETIDDIWNRKVVPSQADYAQRASSHVNTHLSKQDFLPDIPDPAKFIEDVMVCDDRDYSEADDRTTRKLHRPPAESYLRKEAIDRHLSQFTESSCLIPGNLFTSYCKTHIGRADDHDGEQFVSPKSHIDTVLKQSERKDASGNSYDISALERSLGLKPGSWKRDAGVVKVTVRQTQELGLRMANGREAGSSKDWLPGGKLPNGNPEAVINRIPVKHPSVNIEWVIPQAKAN